MESLFWLGRSAAHLYAVPLSVSRGPVVGALAVFHDASYMADENTKVWRDTFMHVLMQMLLIGAITVIVVRWTGRTPYRAFDSVAPRSQSGNHSFKSGAAHRASLEAAGA